MSGTVHARLIVCMALAGATLIAWAVIAGRDTAAELYQPQQSGVK